MSSISRCSHYERTSSAALAEEKGGTSTRKLHRQVLPFCMKPGIVIISMMLSLVGQVAWTAVVSLSHVDPSWCGAGFAIGIVLGSIHGKWTARMWERDYLRVLTREIAFWDARCAKGTTLLVMLVLGMPILFGLLIPQTYENLAGLQSYIFGFVGGMNLALLLWLRRLPR